MPENDAPKSAVYTGQFWDDVANTIRYITFKLRNPQAAQALKDKLQSDIERMVGLPLELKPYFIDEVTKDTYYPLYVGNFIAFFVIVGDTFEFRRFLYSRRNLAVVLGNDEGG